MPIYFSFTLHFDFKLVSIFKEKPKKKIIGIIFKELQFSSSMWLETHTMAVVFVEIYVFFLEEVRIGFLLFCLTFLGALVSW